MQENKVPIKRTLCYHYGNCSCSASLFSFLGCIRKIAKSGYSFVISVRLSAWNYSSNTGWSFVEFDIRGFFRKSVENFQVFSKYYKHKEYFTWRTIYTRVGTL